MKYFEKRTWKEFRESGLLWFVNRILHLFGWVICFDMDGEEIKHVYPARSSFRGFSADSEEKGFKDLTSYLKHNIESIEDDLS